MPRLQNHGKLTAYGLACGYHDGREFDGLRLSLWQEHGTYHVRLHDHRRGVRACWNSYDTLKAARAFYNQVLRAQSLGVW